MAASQLGRAEARIHTSTSTLGQACDRVELWRVDPGSHTIRLRLRSDSYRVQCYAIAERWDGDAWREVWSIAPAAMATPEGVAYLRDDRDRVDAFTGDILALLARVAEVLR
jgi:hypothetical protein